MELALQLSEPAGEAATSRSDRVADGLRILSLPLGADTGGVTHAIQSAFETVNPEGWSFRSIISTLNYIDYPRDMEWSRVGLRRHWLRADVIHLHHNLSYLRKLMLWNLPAKHYVLEFHGTGFREDPETHLAEMRKHRALGLCSTLDLWLLSPHELEWLPCPVRERERMTHDGLRIAHAPTNRQVKSTQAFLDATEQLQKEGHRIEVDLIEGVPWAECLERKAKADIYFDQVTLGYGNNAIECWGMGIPVIAGAQPATRDEMTRRFGELPFYAATEDTIYDALKRLVMDAPLREEYGRIGLNHVRRFHDERVVVSQLQGIYRRAMG